MVASRSEYSNIQVKAARRVMLELMRLLGEYRDYMVIVGGWVPELLLSGSEEPHIGSIDVDIALNHRCLQEEGYETIRRILLNRGYTEGKQPFIFHRSVTIENQIIDVEVDFLAGEYAGTGKSHRTQAVQDVRARKARGCDLAFDMNIEITLGGTLPSGGIDSTKVRIASMVPFLVMKGMALYDRIKEKDAWDIIFCIKNYPGGVDKLVQELQPHVTNSLVIEGLRKIADKFASPNHTGPRMIADFDGIEDPEEREYKQRDAYERVKYLLSKLGIV